MTTATRSYIRSGFTASSDCNKICILKQLPRVILKILTYSVEQSKLQWEYNSVGNLYVSVVLFHVFKAFQVKGKDVRKALYSHTFLRKKWPMKLKWFLKKNLRAFFYMGLLIRWATVTLELVIVAKHLSVAEVP